MTENFLKQLKEERILNAWLASQQKGHAVLLLGDSFKCRAAVEFVLTRLLGQKGLEFKGGKAHPDIDFLPDDSKPITVDMVRELKLSVGRKACLLPYRICVIEQANRMNVQAQNALLKLLEEPPTEMLFVFTARGTAGFLDTVISRVIKINLKPILPGECKAILESEFGVEEARALRLATVFDGDLAEAVECAGSEENQKLFELAKRAAEGINLGDFYELAVALNAAGSKEELVRLLRYTKLLLASESKLKAKEAVWVLGRAERQLEGNANLGLVQSWVVAALIFGGISNREVKV